MGSVCAMGVMNLSSQNTSVLTVTREVRPSRVDELVARARDGEATAFNQLVELYKDRIYNYVARMVHDPIEAEDIAQEAFVKAYRNLHSFRGASTFQTWLYRIASNLTIDSVRRRRRREHTCSLDSPLDTEEGQMSREQEDTHCPGPIRSLETAELQRTVHRAIQTLSPKLRSVVVLYELQGLSYDEIAAILDCPLGTVKSRLFNARMELKTRLQDILPHYATVA
jgi:RNA polymerase sigma-70 factor, ECF subfamily